MQDDNHAGASRYSRRAWLAGAAALCAGAALPRAASATSAQSVARIIVPFPPGGPADFMGRLLAEKLKDTLGRTVLVDNRPGAGTRVAAEALKHAPADGGTVLLTPVDTMVIAPLIYSNLRYQPATDFTAITDVAGVQFGLAVPADAPYKTLAQFVQAARAEPKAHSIGISTVGTLLHFLATEFVARARTGSTIVPYRGGSPLVTEVLGKQIAAGMDATTTFVEYHRAGKLRVLAVAGERRADALPAVPTFAEAGYPELVAASRYLLYAPAATPPAVLGQWQQSVRKALAMGDVRDKLERTGYDLLAGSSPEEVARYVSGVSERWGPVIKASGFKGD
ncbi:ABC transporter substrate-binding protein [Cupriavidus sp. USMAA2-4]|uniref:Bug family tripartite tricarboxylate transporter substrate binding protein n=1 Tax=unclassified Cupriavidus TaxID=2640874 RepID=UPI0008A67ECC|nr:MULTISPECIES: Bug family tripartite tricarboxylate transporter substrate binding protein [unclassified Cupriavidus]AOY94952.1 ABC transporter substrate-binding protein [Cupriavidus sp. USMAA2-4]AOZ02169.1 ABC transporter substrate-binding protein [Cupriavidus sp. USMAHM13]